MSRPGPHRRSAVRRTPSRAWIGAVLWLAAAAPAQPCDVPVFRYALERWAPDRYEAVVFHTGDAPPLLGSAPGRFGTADAGKPLRANLAVRTVDVAKGIGASDRGLLGEAVLGEAPQMVLVGTGFHGSPREVWRARATPAAADAILHSPVRTEIANRLLDGQSAVFVLVESGDRGRDDAAWRLAQGALAAAQATLSLPVPAPGSGIDPDAIARLRVEFSMIRVARDDPAETPLVRMLLATEWDLEASEAPILLPVFGRGRVLYALVGDGISPENILRACAFLVGPCACEIKDQNPGADLLMAVDWAGRLRERIVDAAALEAIAAASNYVEIAASAGAAEGRDEPAGDGADARSADHGLASNLGVVLAVIFAALAAVTAGLWRRGR